MAYSLKTSGNARRTIMVGRGAGIDLGSSDAGILTASAGVLGVSGNDTTAAADATVGTGDQTIFVKNTNNVQTHSLNISNITRRQEYLVANRGSATAITISSITDAVAGESHILRIFDHTEGTEPSHREEYVATNTGAVLSQFATLHTNRSNKFNREGVGVESRWTVTESGGTLTITPTSSETITIVTLTKYDANGVASSLSNQRSGKGSLTNAQITLPDALQLLKEGQQYGYGFNEAGFERGVDVNIGDGGAVPEVGDTLLEIEYTTTPYSKSRPAGQQEFKQNLILIMDNSDAIAAVKKIFAFS